MVRPVGRQPRLRHRRRRCRRWSRAGVTRPTTRRSGGRCAGWRTTRTPTAAGARTCAPTATRPGSGRGDVHRLADRVGAAGAARRRRGARRRSSAGCGWLVEHPAPRRHLGRAAVHRHRLPRRLLHQLPPLPAGLPAVGAGPLPGRHAGGASGATDRRAVCLHPAARSSGGRCSAVRVARAGGAHRPGRRGGGATGGAAARHRRRAVVAGVRRRRSTPALRAGRRGGRHRGAARDGAAGRLPVGAAAGRGAAPRRAARARRPARHHAAAASPATGAPARWPRRARSPSTWSPRPLAAAAGRPVARRAGGRRHRRPTPLLRPGHAAARRRGAARAAPAPRPAVDEWAAAPAPREVVLAAPRSFCAGVERAIDDRRARPRAATAPRSTCAARSCTTRTSSPTWSRAARCSSRSSTRCPPAPRWCSPRTVSPPQVRATAAERGGCTSSTRPARWSPRCTPRSAGTPRRGRHGAAHRPPRPRGGRGHPRRGAGHVVRGRRRPSEARAVSRPPTRTASPT